jgi:hypothetical protein
MSDIITVSAISLIVASLVRAWICIDVTHSQMMKIANLVYEARAIRLNRGLDTDAMPYPDPNAFQQHFWLLFFFLSPDRLHERSINAIKSEAGLTPPR